MFIEYVYWRSTEDICKLVRNIELIMEDYVHELVPMNLMLDAGLVPLHLFLV